MGKVLVIKGANFSQNAIENVTPRGEINMTYLFSFTPGYQIIGAPNPTQGKQGLKSGTSVVSMFSASNYVKIPSNVTQLRIVCIVRKYTESAFTGLAFYNNTAPEPTIDSNPTVVGGHYYTDKNVDRGYTEEKTIDVPAGATYVRTTIFGEGSSLGDNTIQFYCYGIRD